MYFIDNIHTLSAIKSKFRIRLKAFDLLIPYLTNIYKRLQTRRTHRIRTLPILIMMPHSSCNCRCVMCDIWKANANKKELSAEDLTPHLAAIRRLNVRQIVFSGGEPLMHRNFWKLCQLFRGEGINLTLLSTGLLLKKHAGEVTGHIDEVIVSLDGSEPVHDRIRNIPGAYKKLKEGIAALKALDPGFKVTGRCVLQKLNYRDLKGVIKAARELNLDQISFLPADVSSEAFNRSEPWDREKVDGVRLGTSEVEELSGIVESVIDDFRQDFKRDFIAESPEKMRQLARYYRAINGNGGFPPVACNAPWVSAVLESDGELQPCFFHKSYGNIFEDDLETALNAQQAIRFRKRLNTGNDPVCERCVCSLNLSPFAKLN